jgi:elongation factor Ts
MIRPSISRIVALRQAFAYSSSKCVRGAAVDVAAVKKLREMSGAPMMDCKNALGASEVQGNLEKALAWLRAKGIAKMAQANRVTKEGLIGLHFSADGSSASLVEVNCETDFVGMNKDFQRFVSFVAQTVDEQVASTDDSIPVADILKLKPSAKILQTQPKAFTSIDEALGDIVASIREPISIKRVKKVSGILSSYVHNRVVNEALNPFTHIGKAISVVQWNVVGSLSAEQNDELRHQIGRRLAMHIVAAKPLYLSSDSVPQAFIEQELAIFREQANEDKGNSKKKPEMIEKAIQGKLNKRLAEVCLLSQQHLAEEGSPVVRKYLEGLSNSWKAPLNVMDFHLWTLNQQS